MHHNGPPQLRERLFFIASVQNIVAVVVQCCWTEWSGCARKERNCDHFVGIENSKKRMRSRVKNWPGIRTRFWCLLVLAHFSKAQKTAPFLGLHFGAGEPLSSPFLEPQTERPCLQQCSWVTPDCSQSLLVLNTYSCQTIKLKLSAFLPNAAATVAGVFLLICSIS